MAQKAIIDISPSRLIVALVARHQVLGFRTIALDGRDWAERWSAWLARAEGPARAMLNDVGARGLEATVIYASPTAAAGVFACPTGAGPTAAQHAARLALAEQATFPLSDHPGDEQVLGTDRAGAESTNSRALTSSSAGPTAPQRHTLAVADVHTSAEVIASWARGVGVEPTALVPDDVPALVATFDAALDADPATGPRAILWFGERNSVLAAGSGGTLRFIRVLRLGTETLLDALQRPLRRPLSSATQPDGGEPITLDRAKARELLARTGVPEATTPIADLGLTGAAILPIVQPVLQRFGVELKQSLRFGLAEDERAAATLILHGPGSLVPRLGEVLASQCGIPCAAANGTMSAELLGEPGKAHAVAWRALERLQINLLPERMQTTQAFSRMRKAVWAGGAAALALLGSQAFLAQRELGAIRVESAGVAAQLDAKSGAAATADAALKAVEARQTLDARIHSIMGATVDWSSLLALLAEATPDAISLTSVQGTGPSGALPTLIVSGHIHSTPGVSAAERDAAAVLRQFADRLAAAPIVTQAKLGATQRTRVRNVDVQRFDMTITLVPVPAGMPFPTQTTAATSTNTEVPRD